MCTKFYSKDASLVSSVNWIFCDMHNRTAGLYVEPTCDFGEGEMPVCMYKPLLINPRLFCEEMLRDKTLDIFQS